MIVSLRIDDRLVHGQVVTNWVRSLKINSVVVANDAASRDGMQKAVTKMALGDDIKSMICPVDKAISVLNDPRCGTMRILVVCKNISDAVKLVKGVNGIRDVNVANYYRDTSKEGKKIITKTLWVNETEIQDIKAMIDAGAECYTQSSVTDTPKGLVKYL